MSGKPAQSWHQYNVALQRRAGGALPSARAVFRELVPLVQRWREDEWLDCFFFVRKPPDLRLRLRTTARDEIDEQLGERLAALAEAGAVTQHFRSVYEPETRKFGGPEAMEHAHAYFDADTRAWLALDSARQADQVSLATEPLCTAVINDLLTRALADPGEVWDAWCNYAELVGEASDETAAPARLTLQTARQHAQHASERRVLDAYAEANRALADGLLQVQQAGRLQCGLRGMLPFVAMLHVHRHGLGPRGHAAIARGMARAWDPRRRMRGG